MYAGTRPLLCPTKLSLRHPLAIVVRFTRLCIREHVLPLAGAVVNTSANHFEVARNTIIIFPVHGRYLRAVLIFALALTQYPVSGTRI